MVSYYVVATPMYIILSAARARARSLGFIYYRLGRAGLGV